MRDVWAIRWHTSKNFVHAQKSSTTSPYSDVYQRASACSQLIQNLPITYSAYASVYAIFFIRRHTLSKSSRCDRAISYSHTMYIYNSKWKPPIIKLSSQPFQVATYYESYPNFQAPKVFVKYKQIWTLGHYARWSPLPLAKREEERVRERNGERGKGRERY